MSRKSWRHVLTGPQLGVRSVHIDYLPLGEFGQTAWLFVGDQHDSAFTRVRQ